jgi:chromosome partitioning protein
VRARVGNPRLQFAVVQNAVEPRTTLAGTLRNDLASMGLPVLDLAIARRIAHAESMARGSTASRDDADGRAAQEIRELLDTVESLRAHCGAARHLQH